MQEMFYVFQFFVKVGHQNFLLSFWFGFELGSYCITIAHLELIVWTRLSSNPPRSTFSVSQLLELKANDSTSCEGSDSKETFNVQAKAMSDLSW